MGQLVTLDTFKADLRKLRPAIRDAMPSQFRNPERMARIALTAVRTTPSLLKCDPKSLYGAIIQAAQLGLEPGPGLNQCCIIPRRIHGKLMAQFQPEYGGLIELATRSDRVLSIDSAVVYTDEHFYYDKGEQVLQHQPKIDRKEPPTEDMFKCAYAIAYLRGGARTIEVCAPYVIFEARAKSSAWRAFVDKKRDTCIWNDHPEPMWRKTAIIRVCKYIPKSAELCMAIEANTQSEYTEEGQDTSAIFEDAIEGECEDVTDKPAATGKLFDKEKTDGK